MGFSRAPSRTTSEVGCLGRHCEPRVSHLSRSLARRRAAKRGLNESQRSRQATWRPMSERRGRARPCGLLSRWGSPSGLASKEGCRARRGLASLGAHRTECEHAMPLLLSGCQSVNSMPLPVPSSPPSTVRPGGGGFVGVPPRGGLDTSSQPAGGLGSQAGWAPETVHLPWSWGSGLGSGGRRCGVLRASASAV